MFDAPEAAGGDGAFLRRVGDLRGCVRVQREPGGGGEGAEEALEEGGQLGGHDGEAEVEEQPGR